MKMQVTSVQEVELIQDVVGSIFKNMSEEFEESLRAEVCEFLETTEITVVQTETHNNLHMSMENVKIHEIIFSKKQGVARLNMSVTTESHGIQSVTVQVAAEQLNSIQITLDSPNSGVPKF